MLRIAIAWTLYALGDAVYVVFDRWTSIGMRGPIYKLYNGLMCASCEVQGEGRGPWSSTAPKLEPGEKTVALVARPPS